MSTASPAAAASAYSANDFGTGDDFGAEPSAAAPGAGGLDLDLGLDAPATSARDNAIDFGSDLSDMETALPQPADASVSPASVAAQSGNLMDFDLGDMSFEPVASDKAGQSATRKLETRVRRPPSSRMTARARLPTR